MSLYAIPVRRPMATAMVFVAIFLLGGIAWQRIPVEFMPPVSGNDLYVSFARPGSEPEAVEREILLPLQARVGELIDVSETWAEVAGSTGTFQVRFAPGTDLKVRELELNRLASELARNQPPGTSLVVQQDGLSRMTQSRFAMYLQVTGLEDRNSLLDFVRQRIVPRVAAVPGVAQVQSFGGAPRELTVRVDADRCAAVGILPDQVIGALSGAVRRLEFVGGVEDDAGRTAVILDGRPQGVVSLANLRVDAQRPILLRHVAEVDLGVGREESQYRVDGKPAIGLVLFQEEGTNLVRLSKNLQQRFDELRNEFATYGVDFVVNFDAGEDVQTNLNRLKKLALSGFVIALAVLFLFLRQWRAVSVVAVAVPASLLSALALLYLFGQSLNLITLFGLALGIGMLVDNSIVVYEAVQRQLEQGGTPDQAAEGGVRRTVRAILAATLTNAVVFLPISFIDVGSASVRSLLEVLVLAILLPLAGSVLVAVGLVPLLARRLAAPAALRRIQTNRRRREERGGWRTPDRARALFGGMLTVALRKPGGWLAILGTAIVLTVIIALPWVTGLSVNQEPPEEIQIRLPIEITSGASMERALGAFTRIEEAVRAIEGVDRVESFVQEQGGSLTVHLRDKDERPADVDAGTIRETVRRAMADLDGVGSPIDGQSAGGGGGGGGGGGLDALLGQGPAEIILSGPDSRQLESLAREIKAQLDSVPEIGNVSVAGREGRDEIRVVPMDLPLESLGLTADQVLPALNLMPREGVQLRNGYTQPDGREIPLVIRRTGEEAKAGRDLRNMRLSTPAGVVPLAALAEIRRMPPPQTIQHHNGRREIAVRYTLGPDAPQTGPARLALEREIREATQNVYRPAGYSVETPEGGESTNWFKKILVPVVLLLFAVLALTFESLILPVLVLLALPLTILGAAWALALAGMPAGMMALVGAITLIGLTVNPAILLVDRMQQHAWQGGRTAGAAAFLAVRERARPVLMTAATTVAGLWPLALVTGEANEIWPPFATIVMGGLVTSTLLTLLVIPVGFVFLHRLDRLLGRLGPWLVLGWLAVTTAIMFPMIRGDVITTLTWQIITTVFVAGLLLGAIVLAFRRTEFPEPASEDGPPKVEVRALHKTYGRPGPIGRAWRVNERFARRVLDAGASPFDPRDAWSSLLPLALLLGGALFLATTVETTFWRMIYAFVAAGLASSVLRQLRRARGRVDELGRVIPGGVEGAIAMMAPWAAYTWLAMTSYVYPTLEDRPAAMGPTSLILIGLIVAIYQAGRHTAVLLSRGMIAERLDEGFLRRSRTVWRRLSRRLFGLDLPREEVYALRGVEFTAQGGMVGILGPNGAGKTTLLRQMAGILDPSVGNILIGGVPVKRLRRYLARWLGYLPQDFGLPDDLTAREYLEYFALLYELKPAAHRRERVQQLLTEVGLGDRADEKIGDFSGGMRQRVAVARTLLRLPPVIIVDEPTVGLDPRERIRFRNLLARLAEGRVVLFSTHVVEDVEVACERVIVLARGRKVFDGIPVDLADAARGKVWTARLLPGEEEQLPADAMLVDQVPEAAGTVLTRILCDHSPVDGATPSDPNLEDGYLWLVGEAPV